MGQENSKPAHRLPPRHLRPVLPNGRHPLPIAPGLYAPELQAQVEAAQAVMVSQAPEKPDTSNVDAPVDGPIEAPVRGSVDTGITAQGNASAVVAVDAPAAQPFAAGTGQVPGPEPAMAPVFGPRPAPFRCQICGKDSYTADNLKEHVTFLHIGTRCFWQGCGFAAANEVGLRQHIILAHKWTKREDGRFQCNWRGDANGVGACQKTFATPNSATRCARKHTFEAAMRERENAMEE
ncbi:uncharacterized protein GGS25DRAFT_518459 [Hypoxylon fragiforme]|uniref:uncharacterized protein n=1 Tax=Hypoxylon fragiforme TaxID=63214 RepID=UPI0020C6F103|nr:uncharacterized protein GGS25DRAFT_518459 [Hypoxylon fragiforme]KAI2612772.1 hypothetical protein GGS25DRAFT_518459 [Hypoxylon fragiforme]